MKEAGLPVVRRAPASGARAEDLPSSAARSGARVQREALCGRLPLARLRDVDARGRGWLALKPGRAAAARSDTRLGRTARLGAARDRSRASCAAACRRAAGARRAPRAAAPGRRDAAPVLADVPGTHVATGLRTICGRLALRSRRPFPRPPLPAPPPPVTPPAPLDPPPAPVFPPVTPPSCGPDAPVPPSLLPLQAAVTSAVNPTTPKVKYRVIVCSRVRGRVPRIELRLASRRTSGPRIAR